MRAYAVVIVAAGLLATLGCQHAGEHSHSHEVPAPDIDGLRAASAKWEEAFDSGDAAATAAIYSADARVFPPEMPPVEGRAAIQGLWQGLLDAAVSAEIKPEDLDASGDLGYRVGAYVLTAPDGAVVDEGHFMEVWEKTDAGWMMIRDIWNSDLPAEGEEL